MSPPPPPSRGAGPQATPADFDEQLRRLIRTEQRLFVSQRELAQQLRRVDALNRFALEAGATRSRTSILERAATFLFSVFPLDQAVGFDVDGEALVPAVATALPGRQGRQERLRDSTAPVMSHASDDGALAAVDTIAAPALGYARELAGSQPELAPLLAACDDLFDEDTGSSGADAFYVVLPLPIGECPPAFLVLRNSGQPLSFHEALPTEKDAPFLSLVAQEVGVALANARLVESLTESYGALARTQQELVTRERLAALGELAAVVAHEVRNPLGVIFNSLTTLRRIVPSNADAEMLLSIVHEEAERLNGIVGDLLDFAGPAPARRVPGDFARAVTEAVERTRALAAERGVEVSVDIRSSPSLTFDPRMVHQVLVNLVTNAIQASPEGQRVGVRVDTDGAESSGALVEVVDRGTGIDEPLLPHIFEPFVTTRARGTGLGLAIVKRFVEAHQGWVSVSTRTEDGTRFSVWFAPDPTRGADSTGGEEPC